MKKIKILLAVMLMVLIVAKDCAVAQASEVGVKVTSEGITVRELSPAELRELPRDLTVETMGSEVLSSMATNASYTAYEYSESFNFTLGDTLVARADAKCIVWHYTDNKVHLYNRTITVSRLATYDASRTYGSIVNTDGSLSYTTGDMVHLYGITSTWDFAIDFRVTPTDASFSCYEV